MITFYDLRWILYTHMLQRALCWRCLRISNLAIFYKPPSLGRVTSVVQIFDFSVYCMAANDAHG